MRFVGLLAGAALAVAVAGQAAATTTFDFVFDNQGLGASPPATPPFVGSGTVTISNDPGNGTFALGALGTVDMSFTFGDTTFANADITTTLSDVLVVLTATPQGQQFQFSNVDGFGNGDQTGSIDFDQDGGAVFLTFEPPGYANGQLTLYQEGVETDDPSGNYLGLAVPEPATWLLMLVGIGGLGAALRRRTLRA